MNACSEALGIVCSEVLGINDIHSKVLYRRGVAYMHQQLLELARKGFDKALALGSNNANIKKQLAKLDKLEKQKEPSAPSTTAPLLD